MKRLFRKIVLVLAMCVLLAPVTSYAAASTSEMVQFPNVTLSPDGTKRAWTTDAGDKTNERLPYEYTVDMHAESTLGEPGIGQHFYGKQAEGSVTIGKWVVKHTPGQCIHDTPTKDTFAGFTYRNEICHSYYNNGWFAYCADCGELAAPMLIYAKESTIRQITSVPASSIYVYLCPYCTHLEQGYQYQHYCKGISSNRYRVTYRPNAPADSTVAGYMAPTMHMYDNSTSYNGEPASEIGYTDTTLRKNGYSCNGYIFGGWNTEPDGSGQSFSDEQEILNLTTVENGVVKMYAQWIKAESTLVLDAAGGTYNGQAIYEQKQKYGTSYKVDCSLILPPAGYEVSFQTNGGTVIDPITTIKHFSHWEIQAGFSGKFKEDVYWFMGENGNRDRLKAQYMNVALQLPDCNGNNVSLVGWYDDPGLKDENFVGKPGDAFIVEQDTVLYAKWASLTLWAYDDYDSYDGAGAVDLKWEQKDGKSKYYRLYQMEEDENWKEIYTGTDVGKDVSIARSYGSDTQGDTYTIAHTGFYTLSAMGAKGADYDSSRTGGAGGKVTATYWLEEGNIVTFYAGCAGKGQSGGTNGNGADGGDATTTEGRGGGAATQIYLTRHGQKTLLLTAAGGGGANAYYGGGAGGNGGGNGTHTKGASGVGAGGGGAPGGTAGIFVQHIHEEAVCGYHEHDGNTATGGACYLDSESKTEYCGETDSYYQGPCKLWWDAANNRCVRCHGTDPNYIHYGHICKNCGADIVSVVHYVTKTVYSLTCEVEEGWQCGKTSEEGSYAPSYGGKNFVNMEFGCKNAVAQEGINSGEGSAAIVSLDIGYMEDRVLFDVLAMDHAAPEEIPEYRSALSAEDVLRFRLAEPDDKGTLYYHKAESYEEGSSNVLATSNITANTLTSGICGYRYYVDTKATGTVGTEHTFTEKNYVDAAVGTIEQYLHVAAVDVAGNIGPTKNILIKAKEAILDSEIEEEYIEDVPLKTEQLRVEDTDHVYDVGNGTYYVKADDATEHILTIAGYVDGKATNQYQVEWLQILSSAGAAEEWYQTRIPKVDVDGGERTFENMQLETDASVEELRFLQPTNATAVRMRDAAKVVQEQRFVLNTTVDGLEILVYPKAAAAFDEVIYYSDAEEDRQHAIILIPDAKPPVITGIDALEDAGNIDMTEESRDFVITATDDGSGMKGLLVTIINQDNQMIRTYSSDTGNLTITIQKEDYLFLGDFAVTAKAVDNVGNESVHESDKLAFTLKADLQRARFPYHGNFKAGDGAVLTITTGGYADKVVIRFPEELLALNPDLDQEYVYEYPEAMKTEIYTFNIPLDTPSGSYTITVEAWKNGRKLTEELELPVRTVGSIIEEFRTRIRDNGV